MPFDIDETSQVQKIEEKKSVSLRHFLAPKNDNERLLEYQFQYKKGDKKALDSLYMLSLKVAKKMIKTKAKKNKHIAFLSTDEVSEKAHDAVSYIIERFLKIPNFYIEKSFTAYIYLRVQYELFYHRKIDKIISFYADIEDIREEQN